MNKETVKEWLDDISTPTGISYSGDRTLSNSEVGAIIDFINELQEENKQLKDGWQQEVNHKEEILNNWLELQQRIDKTIEYIEKNSFDKQEKPMIWVRVFKKDLHGYANELLEILKGE